MSIHGKLKELLSKIEALDEGEHHIFISKTKNPYGVVNYDIVVHAENELHKKFRESMKRVNELAKVEFCPDSCECLDTMNYFCKYTKEKLTYAKSNPIKFVRTRMCLKDEGNHERKTKFK